MGCKGGNKVHSSNQTPGVSTSGLPTEYPRDANECMQRMDDQCDQGTPNYMRQEH